MLTARRVSPPALRRGTRFITPLGRLADLLTLGALVLIPNGGLAIGGTLGFAYGDVLFVAAVIARAGHILIAGLPLGKLRRQSFLFGMVAALTGWGFISGIVNGNPVTLIYVFLVFTLFTSIGLVATFGGDDHEENIRRLTTAFAIGCAVLAASSFYTPTAQGRTIGYAIHPNALGHTLIMGLAVTIWRLDRSVGRRERLMWGGAVVLQGAGVMQSGSRGGTLAVLVLVVLYLCLRGSARVVLGTLAAVWAASLLLLLGAVNIGYGNPIERLLGDTTSEASDAERRDLLEQNIEDIGEDPLFGKGWDTISDIHIVYFQGWVGGGFIPALVLMLLGVTMVLMPLWQPKRELALACGAAGLAVAWLFTNIFTARDQWIFLAFAFGQSPSPLVLRGQIRSVLRR